ncbi:MAG: DUF1189 domain-containing protein [Candidatus Magasanikbacteria bacterium]|nr:DUF1189 domain-containing protein [Candidatus Magasanikbacteria bacterium]
MYYLKAFVNSLFNFAWIRERRKDMGKAGAYFIFFVLFVSLLYSVFFAWKIPQAVKGLHEGVINQVPDFSLQIEDGRLNVDKLEQPFVLESREGDEDFLLVVDTKTDEKLVIEDFIDPMRESGVLITRNKVMMHDSKQGQTRVQFFSDIDGVEFDKDDMVYWVGRFTDGLPYFAFFIILLSVFVGLVIGKLVYLLIISLIVWIAAQFGHKNYKYQEIYTLGMYGITLPTLLKLVLDIAGYYYIYTYTVLLLFVMLAAVFVKKTKPKKTNKNKPETMV